MSVRDQIRILVVDDMSTSRGLIVQSLEAIGIADISYVRNGNEAIAAMTARAVHIVLSDYNMPGMSGLDLLEWMRSDSRARNTGFILITGRADEGLINRGRVLGMNNFIRKPFTTPELRTCLEAVVGRL